MQHKNPKRRSPIIKYIAEAWERRPNHTFIQLLDELNIIAPQFDYQNDQRLLDMFWIPLKEEIRPK